MFRNGEEDLLNILEPSTFVFFFKLHFIVCVSMCPSAQRW